MYSESDIVILYDVLVLVLFIVTHTSQPLSRCASSQVRGQSDHIGNTTLREQMY